MPDLNRLTDLTLETDRTGRSVLIELEKIECDPKQPRKNFDNDKLKELAQSMETFGLLQPITVQRFEKKYIIVTGERRFRAARLLGWKKINATLLNKDLPEDESGYRQMIENLKREELSADEIAEFICGRINAGEPQTKIAERLGFSKSLISQYARWEIMPDLIKDAVKKKKINDIKTAYILDDKYQKIPEEVERLISDSSYISRLQAQNLEQDAGGKVSPGKLYPSANSPLSTSKETFAEDYAAPVEQDDPIEEQTTETLDDEFDDNDEKSIVPKEEQEIESGNETPASPISHSEETEDFSPTLDSDKSTTNVLNDEEDPDKSEKLEEVADTILSNDKPAEFKNPVWLCFCDERDCELLWKRKPKTDGFVLVKYEDGTEEEVLAETVRLNRVIEA